MDEDSQVPSRASRDGINKASAKSPKDRSVISGKKPMIDIEGPVQQTYYTQ